MNLRGRSWLLPPRWWLEVVRPLLGVAAVVAVITVEPRGWDVDWSFATFLALVSVAGNLCQTCAEHQDWRSLEASSPASREELLAAERVVRRGEEPSGDVVAAEALRMAEAYLGQVGGARWPWACVVAVVVGMGLVVWGVSPVRWSLLLVGAVCVVGAAVQWRGVRVVAGRRERLRRWVASPVAR